MGVKTAPERFVKRPGEVVKKDIDFAGEDLASGETIVSVTSVTISPSGELAETHTFSGSKVQLTLSAGFADTVYSIIAKVVTTAGQTLEGEGIMTVGN